MMKYNYGNFNQRRQYEWKLVMAIWTALVAFIGIFITNDLSFHWLWIFPYILVISFMLWIQYRFLYWLQSANDVDKRRAEFYETCIVRDTNASLSINANWGVIDERLSAQDAARRACDALYIHTHQTRPNNQVVPETSRRPRLLGERRWSTGEWTMVTQLMITFILALFPVVLNFQVPRQNDVSPAYTSQLREVRVMDVDQWWDFLQSNQWAVVNGDIIKIPEGMTSSSQARLTSSLHVRDIQPVNKNEWYEILQNNQGVLINDDILVIPQGVQEVNVLRSTQNKIVVKTP
jgi:hypothetical protein